MKYIYYISKPKIDMLYGQISEGESTITSSIKADLGFLSGSISEKHYDNNSIYRKLYNVISNLDYLGGIDEEAAYISGPMTMGWGNLRFTSNATYWIGKERKGGVSAYILLIGSAKNIVGNMPNSHTLSYSNLNLFIDAYANDIDINDRQSHQHPFLKNEKNVTHMIERIFEDYNKNNPQQIKEYNFVAKTLFQQKYDWSGYSELYTIATPLYVSEAT